MASPLSPQLRSDIEAYIHRGETTHQIHHRTFVSESQINTMRRNLGRYGAVVPPKLAVQGRPRIVSPLVENALLEYLEQRPNAYRDEMCWFLWDEFELVVAERSMSNILKRLGWTHKKASHRASQRDQTLRDEWRARLCDWEPEQLVFLDESAACERTNDRKYGWSPMGINAGVNTLLKRSQRWSILPAFITEGYIASMMHHGFITKDLFIDFVRNDVLPLCTPAEFKGPNSVIIMNNAKIHMSEELNNMCEAAGITLARLPPYSPDYNPIETSFAVLKLWMKKNEHLARYYGPTTEDFGKYLQNAVDGQNQRNDSGALFRAAGIDYHKQLL